MFSRFETRYEWPPVIKLKMNILLLYLANKHFFLVANRKNKLYRILSCRLSDKRKLLAKVLIRGTFIRYLLFSITAVTTNTRPRMVFSLCWNLSFRRRQTTVSMVFPRPLTEQDPSSLNEGRRLTRIISNDDSLFKMKDYVKKTRFLQAE